jgi:hypothetical protein
MAHFPVLDAFVKQDTRASPIPASRLDHGNGRSRHAHKEHWNGRNDTKRQPIAIAVVPGAWKKSWKARPDTTPYGLALSRPKLLQPRGNRR